MCGIIAEYSLEEEIVGHARSEAPCFRASNAPPLPDAPQKSALPKF
jgi:hypothetical protein